MDTATATADSPRDLLKQRGLRATRRRLMVLRARLDASAPLRVSIDLPRWSPAIERARIHVTLAGVCPDCGAVEAA